jgi:hypothetical protein
MPSPAKGRTSKAIGSKDVGAFLRTVQAQSDGAVFLVGVF